MNVADAPRLVTALLVGALCALTIARAIPELRFGFITSALSGDSAVAALAPLVDDRRVGAWAREARLEIAPPTEQRLVARELGDILSRRPLSSLHWLELARARYAEGASPEQYFRALNMSQLTGPNEASIMAARAVFGLSLWSLAPADLRKAVTRDLVGGWPQVSETRRMLLRIMFADAFPQTRTEIVSSLSQYGEEGASIAARLGLDSAP